MLEQPSNRRFGVHTRRCMGWRPRRGGGLLIPTLGGSVVGGWHAIFGEQDIRYGAGSRIRAWRLWRRWVTLGVNAALGIICRAGLGRQ